MNRGECPRCGRPYQVDDTEFSHVTCDEMSAEENETWLTEEERKEKAERIRAYEKKKK